MMKTGGSLCGWVCALVTVASIAASAPAAVVIDHSSVAAVGSLPQATLDRVASELNFFFAHASVGGNMMDGLASLHTSNPTRYPLTRVTDNSTPPATTSKGIVYEGYRQNDWDVKVDSFAGYLSSGWGTAVDVVMNKLCYIDQAADFEYYAVTNTNNSAINQLEPLYPDTVFVYMTMPLRPGGGDYNVMRNEFNDALRQWVQDNDKVLFDIADIEAHDPEGNPITFVDEGVTYQSLYSEYTYDSGHLNALGAERVALGFYALGAEIVPEPATMFLFLASGATLIIRRKQ